MNHKWLLLLLTLMVFSTNALSYQPSLIEIVEQIDDVRFVAFIRESDLENYPQWNSMKEAPPLTIAEAVQAVHNYHKKNNAELAAETVNKIELKKITRHEKYWHYLVKIKVNSSKKARYQIYVVLMNGKVIPALNEPPSYK